MHLLHCCINFRATFPTIYIHSTAVIILCVQFLIDSEKGFGERVRDIMTGRNLRQSLVKEICPLKHL